MAYKFGGGSARSASSSRRRSSKSLSAGSGRSCGRRRSRRSRWRSAPSSAASASRRPRSPRNRCQSSLMGHATASRWSPGRPGWRNGRRGLKNRCPKGRGVRVPPRARREPSDQGATTRHVAGPSLMSGGRTVVRSTSPPWSTFGTGPDRDDATRRARHRMVAHDLAARDIHDERVLAAMESVPSIRPRGSGRRRLRGSSPPIGVGQTISPALHPSPPMAQEARIRAGRPGSRGGDRFGLRRRVLGRLAAEVWTIERHEDLARRAREALRGDGGGQRARRRGRRSPGAPDPRPSTRRRHRSRSSGPRCPGRPARRRWPPGDPDRS